MEIKEVVANKNILTVTVMDSNGEVNYIEIVVNSYGVATDTETLAKSYLNPIATHHYTKKIA